MQDVSGIKFSPTLNWPHSQTFQERKNRDCYIFVIVGGGPTGVEFGAEFYDFLQQVSKMNI